MIAKVQCALCQERYTAPSKQLHLGTMICASCYRRMQAQPLQVSCFGKISIYQLQDGKSVQVQRAYNPAAAECNRWCPDRHVCRAVLLGEEIL